MSWLEKDESLLPVLTLVIWVMVGTVGVLGFVLPYARPVAAKKAEPAVQAELLQVELTPEEIPTAQESAPAPAEPVALPAPMPVAPAPPPLIPVADHAKVSFAVPLAAPTQIVEAAQAVYRTPAEDTPRATQPVAQVVPRQLTYGQGEGKQPAPEYPYRARREGQEGVVTVRFTVAESGRVDQAELSGGSPWQLLNEAALEVVRKRWQFRSGERRVYEVAIRFQLTR